MAKSVKDQLIERMEGGDWDAAEELVNSHGYEHHKVTRNLSAIRSGPDAEYYHILPNKSRGEEFIPGATDNLLNTMLFEDEAGPANFRKASTRAAKVQGKGFAPERLQDAEYYRSREIEKGTLVDAADAPKVSEPLPKADQQTSAAAKASPGTSSASPPTSPAANAAAPTETKTPEQKRAEVLAQTRDKSKVPDTNAMHQQRVREYLAARDAATGGGGTVPASVIRSLKAMGYQVPEPDMTGHTLPDGTQEPGWHSASNRKIMNDMADHLGARDLEEELRQERSRKAQAEVAKSRQAKAEASAAPSQAAPPPAPPPPAPPPPATTPTPAAQAASSATTTTAETATPAAPPSATPATPSQAAASTASAGPRSSAASAGAAPPSPPPPPPAGGTPPPASPPPPPRPTVTTAKDAMKRGQRVQGPTGVRNRGSSIHNNSFWQRELHLSSQGLIGGLSSIANDFGLNRRIASYTGKKVSTYLDSWFGKSLSGSGYVHPVEEAGQVIWKSAKTLDAAERGWAQHIASTAENSTGMMGALTKARSFIHGTVLGGQGSMANRALTALGGAGSTIAPLMSLGFAINDARQGYREGGIVGAAAGAGMGYLQGALINKIISGVLLNPVAGMVGGGLLAATMYTSHKIFDVRNKGVEYLRMGRMQGLTWDKGPSPGMSGANIASMRQRSLNAMENSRFNAMKAIGNESYMMSAPKARYANSTAIHSMAPMLSY